MQQKAECKKAPKRHQVYSAGRELNQFAIANRGRGLLAPNSIDEGEELDCTNHEDGQDRVPGTMMRRMVCTFRYPGGRILLEDLSLITFGLGIYHPPTVNLGLHAFEEITDSPKGGLIYLLN